VTKSESTPVKESSLSLLMRQRSVKMPPKEKKEPNIVCDCIFSREVNDIFRVYYDKKMKQFRRFNTHFSVSEFVNIVKISCIAIEFEDKLLMAGKLPPLLSHVKKDMLRYSRYHENESVKAKIAIVKQNDAVVGLQAQCDMRNEEASLAERNIMRESFKGYDSASSSSSLTDSELSSFMNMEE